MLIFLIHLENNLDFFSYKSEIHGTFNLFNAFLLMHNLSLFHILEYPFIDRKVKIIMTLSFTFFFFLLNYIQKMAKAWSFVVLQPVQSILTFLRHSRTLMLSRQIATGARFFAEFSNAKRETLHTVRKAESCQVESLKAATKDAILFDALGWHNEVSFLSSRRETVVACVSTYISASLGEYRYTRSGVEIPSVLKRVVAREDARTHRVFVGARASETNSLCFLSSR